MRTDLTCLSEVPEKVNFMFQVACARWKCNAEGDFSRSRVELAPLGPRGRRPSLRAFLLLAACQKPVDADMHGLPVSHGWVIGAEH